ncbi:MAG: helix-turn-helix protein [Gammaproteobacteria bacterium]|nr:helix-turn-helix protein [Gammaproteobacteria bacterium]
MASFGTFSTEGLEQRRKLDSWDEIAGETFAPGVSNPVDAATLSGSLTCTQVGGLRMAELCSEPTIVRHTLARVGDTRDALFFLLLQLEGTSINRQDERDAKLSPGDFTICATARPYEITLPVPNRRLVIGIPDGLMRRHLACPDDIVAVRMSGVRGMTGLLSNFIKSFWACRSHAVDPAVALRMSYTLLDLIAAAYSVTPHARHEQSSLVAAHRVRIISYIEAHLRDPNLSPTSVAHACKITARYLHHLFTAESETVTQFIQRRRLEECARALIAAPVRGRLVTEVAFEYGFNSLTHFGRVFRNQFGLTPSEYRRASKQQA